MKWLKLTDLNPVLIRKHGTVRAQAMLDFANLTNAIYGKLHTHLIGDCILAKLNMLKRGKKIRMAQ